MSKKLYDPIHFYNEHGMPMSAVQKLQKENARLLTENQRLKRSHEAMIRQRKAAELVEEIPKLH